ncbi:MAG TPA: DUF4286 family protein [Robiginitalea sp.]|nr:DUF4286 family protein [Robiginitalea sp.]
MIIYNVTILVEDPIREAWVAWMQNTHIPEVLATGKFGEARFCRVLTEGSQGGTTYAVQYLAPSRDLLERYYREDAARLRQATTDRFGDKFVAFRTELELVSQH